MTRKRKELFILVFGNKPTIVFKRIMIVVSTIILGIILVQNVSCGYDANGFYFKWGPAAKIEVKKDL